MKASETKFILLHCPQDLVREVDDLCAMNFLNRTEFLVFAIDSMMEFFERRQQAEDARSGFGNEEDCPIPGDIIPPKFFTGEDDKEEVLWAAEEQEGFSADFSWPWEETPKKQANATESEDGGRTESGTLGSEEPGENPFDRGQ